eukprot:2751507-Rhodomonas_salina.1
MPATFGGACGDPVAAGLVSDLNLAPLSSSSYLPTSCFSPSTSSTAKSREFTFPDQIVWRLCHPALGFRVEGLASSPQTTLYLNRFDDVVVVRDPRLDDAYRLIHCETIPNKPRPCSLTFEDSFDGNPATSYRNT